MYYKDVTDVTRTLEGRYTDVTDVTRTLEGRYKDITQMLQGHYCQILTKYDQILVKYYQNDQILTKYDQILVKYYQNDQIHVENFQERHFFRIKKTT